VKKKNEKSASRTGGAQRYLAGRDDLLQPLRPWGGSRLAAPHGERIGPAEPGYRRLLIQPQVGGGITWAHAWRLTPCKLAECRTRPPSPPHAAAACHALGDAKEAFVIPNEGRGVLKTHAKTGTGCIHLIAQHQAARFLEPEVFLNLHRAHRLRGFELVLQSRNAHPHLPGEILDT
jgi:hypothetical protein